MSSNELAKQIMAQVIAHVAMPEQQTLPDTPHPTGETVMAEKSCSLTEFVGTAIGDTLGLAITNVDAALLGATKLEKRYRSIGILGIHTDAGPHIMAANEVAKVTNIEVVSIEPPHDTRGDTGHGSLIMLGRNDVPDVKRGVEVVLKELGRTFGDVYGNEAGHIELQYTARTSYALEKVFGAPLGRAYGIIVGTPTPVGVLMADTTLKSTNIEVMAYSSSAHGISFNNEAILVIPGDSDAVYQAVISVREIDKTVLGTLGAEPKNNRPSYI